MELIKRMYIELQKTKESKESLATKDEIKVLREELTGVDNRLSIMLDLLFSMRAAQIDAITGILIN